MKELEVLAKSKTHYSQFGTGTVGAQSVGNDEATKLDKRIARKVNMFYPTNAISPGAQSVSGAPAVSLDQRIALKLNQGRLLGTKGSSSRKQALKNEAKADSVTMSKDCGTPSPATTPGAIDIGRDEAARLDARIAVKSSFRCSEPASSGLGLVQKHVKADARDSHVRDNSIARRRNRLANGIQSIGENQVDSLDKRIAAKISGFGPSSFGGSDATSAHSASTTTFSGQLASMEEKVAAKARIKGSRAHSIASTSSMSSMSQPSSFPELTPSRSINSNNSNGVSRLDERIDAKIRGVRAVSKDPVEESSTWNGTHTNRTINGAPVVDKKGCIEEHDRSAINNDDSEINQNDVECGTCQHEELAIAKVVLEDDEEKSEIPAAIEYDAYAKKPLYRNHRTLLCGFVSLILLVVVTIGVAVGVIYSGGSEQQPQQPTLTPTTLRETLQIQDQIIAVVGEGALSDPNSSQYLAMDWIINEDPAKLPPEAENLIQRYLMVVFYISTTQVKPWLSCNRPKEGESSSCMFKALVQTFPNETYEDVEWNRWVSEEHECTWAGVGCDDNNYTRSIELSGQQIEGTLPIAITKLTYLQSLNLVWNELHGQIPSELAEMRHLVSIELQYNFLSGVIPKELYSSQALDRISFSGNYLTGQIDTAIGQLTSLSGFFFADNMINGTIPTEIGKLQYLTYARWGHNVIHGTLPTELGMLAVLEELWIYDNQITGAIPSELGNLAFMKDLRIDSNLFSGTIPELFYNMNQLSRFDAFGCNLTGTISTQIGKLSNLSIFRVSDNDLSGTIPTELSNITSINAIWINHNNIAGTVPSAVCALRSPDGLVRLDADCRSGNPAVEPLVTCEVGCCTSCCDSFKGDCVELFRH